MKRFTEQNKILEQATEAKTHSQLRALLDTCPTRPINETMNDSPETPKKPQEDVINKPSGVTIPPKKPIPSAASPEVKPPTPPLKPMPKPVPGRAAATPAKPISIAPTPAGSKPTGPSFQRPVKVDRSSDENKVGPLGLAVDAFAALVAITFAILIFLDVKAFL